MIETGLIVAQVVFLVLLYAFVWSVVRSSGRQIDTPKPPQPPPAPPAPARRGRRATPPPIAPRPAGGGDQDTADALEPGLSPPPAAAAPGVRERERTRAEEAAPRDLGANIHPKLVVERSAALAPGREVALERGLTIGRSSSSGIEIPDPFVSHMHARIVRRGTFLFVEDLGSTNGTFLNDRRVEGDAQLKMRDQLRIGETVLRYEE